MEAAHESSIEIIERQRKERASQPPQQMHHGNLIFAVHKGGTIPFAEEPFNERWRRGSSIDGCGSEVRHHNAAVVKGVALHHDACDGNRREISWLFGHIATCGTVILAVNVKKEHCGGFACHSDLFSVENEISPYPMRMSTERRVKDGSQCAPVRQHWLCSTTSCAPLPVITESFEGALHVLHNDVRVGPQHAKSDATLRQFT